jgi:predicted dehydrogenase
MNVAFLGAGNIARHMAEAVKGLEQRGEDICAYAVAARELSRAQSFAETYGFIKAYGSYEEMLADPQVDLVYIATPHSMHYAHSKMSLEHGKNVLCEKAFTQNAAQAEALIQLAEEKGLLVTEAIWTRYMPSRKIIRELIESGVIGRVTSLSANLGYALTHVPRMVRPELAGGALLDLGVYPINFACMVFGDEIASVTSTCQKWETGVDAQNSITLTFPDGRMAFLYSSMLAVTDRLGVINGENGYIEVQNINNPEEIRIYDRSRKHSRTVAVPEQINGYEYEVLACRDALKSGRLECPDMPHATTLQVMKLMDDLRRDWNISLGEEPELG